MTTSLHHRSDDDVPVLDAGVVALEVDRAGPEHVGPERAADGGEQQRIRLRRDDAAKAWVNGRNDGRGCYRLLADGLMVASTKTKSETGSPFARRAFRA